MILKSVESIFVIFLLIGVGFFVAWKKWVSRDTAKAISKIVINIAVPGTLVYNFSANFSRQQLINSWLPLLIIFIVAPAAFFLGKLAARLFKIPLERRGVFAVSFSLSNSMFIGFPIAQALFGDEGMPYAVFYYLANTTVFWTLGYLAIRKDADMISGSETRVSFSEVLKKLVTPPIITVITMFAAVLFGVQLPDFVLKTAKYLGDMTTPLSLIFTGCMIYFIGIKGLKYQKGIAAVLAGRFVFIPLLCFAACMLVISISYYNAELYLMRDVFTMQMSLPVMIQTAILAELYGADVKYATINVIATTIISVLTIPAYMVFFSLI